MNELIDPNKLSYEEIAALMGQTMGGNQNLLPELKINAAYETNDGKTLKPGTWYIAVNGENVYAPTCKFRPYLNCFQYLHWDREENKLANKSLIVRNLFTEEAVDIKGGVKCGKISSKLIETLTPEQKKLQEQIKCHRYLFGQVSMTGKTVDGKEVVVEDMPCKWRAKGKNYMTPDVFIKQVDKGQKFLFQFVLDMHLIKEKNDDVTYFVADPRYDLTKASAPTPQD